MTLPSPSDLPGIPTCLLPFVIHGVRADLTPLRNLLRAAGDPHLPLRVVLVGGTNGKGSTSSFLADLCRACGLKTGLFQSPSPGNFEDHFYLDGEVPSAQVLGRVAEALLPHVREPLTAFEWATALAIQWFFMEKVGVAVLEVGMGGRDDATNVTEPCLSILTQVDLDHTQVLGNTVEAITAVKLGICRQGRPVITGATGPGLRQIEAETQRLGTPLRVLGRDFLGEGTWSAARFRVDTLQAGPVRLGLMGDHQVHNAALAVAAAWELGLKPEAPQLHKLATTSLPGRMERLSAFDSVWLDGAHNPAGARILAEVIRKEFGAPVHVVLGAYRDKDVGGMGEMLAPVASRFTAVGIHGPRGMSALEVMAQLEGRVGAISVGQAENLEEVLAGAGPVVLTGSLSWIQRTRQFKQETK